MVNPLVLACRYGLHCLVAAQLQLKQPLQFYVCVCVCIEEGLWLMKKSIEGKGRSRKKFGPSRIPDMSLLHVHDIAPPSSQRSATSAAKPEMTN